MATVASLYRYPVKSLHGERVDVLDIDHRGARGDRLWSVRTAAGKIGSGKSTRRFAAVPGLLELRAEERDGRVAVAFPDGWFGVDDPAAAERLSRHAAQPLTFQRESDVSHFDDGPLSLIGLASVQALAAEQGQPVDPTRFRPNLVLSGTEPFEEDSWVGRTVTVGTAVLRVTMVSPRCVMVNLKTAALPAQPGNLATLGRLHDACLGVVASITSPGRISVGDEVLPS